MFDKILVLAPHTDDGEFGCGGAIARFREEKKGISYAAFSICEDSLPEKMRKNILEKEVREATQLLDIASENLFIFRFKVREFPMFRQKILQEMLGLKDKINPDLVFLPSTNDLHQDHKVVTEEGLRAFKGISILGYEIPWNNIVCDATGCIAIEKRHLDKKIAALKCYESQRFRRYAKEDFFVNLAKTRGMQIGRDYAEAFEVLRLVL